MNNSLSNMKKLIILAMCSALAFCSCGQKQTEVEEKVYTEDELGVEIDWNSSGWSEVKNDTDGTVTLITYYNLDPGTEVTTVIKKGEFAKLTAGAYVPGVSIDECIKATIILDDNTTFSCERDSEDAWASRFFENFEQRKEYEYVDIDGKTVSHELIVRTYHIDDELVKLWRDSLPAPGDWPPIKLDRKEYLFNCYSGEVTITALNYESWWINYGYEDARNVNGKIEYDNFVRAEHSEGSYVPDILNGGWYHATVPEKGLSNQLVITVEPNDTGHYRQVIIEMEAGDSFTSVKIYQEADDGMIGNDPPIEADKPEVTFPSEGGEMTVSEINNSWWWLDCGYDDIKNVNGKTEYENFVSATYASNGAVVRNYLDGGWYQALVPNNGQSNQLIITVGPNDTGQQRHATLTLQCCNAFTHLRIYQDF